MAISKLTVHAIGTVLGLIFMTAAGAQQPPARVAYPDIPGAVELERGEIAEGIAILKKHLVNTHRSNRGGVLAALCGAYILDEQFQKAQRVCDEAVKAPGMRAFSHNNRGVLRLIQRDYFGADRDFQRARAGRAGIARSAVEMSERRALRGIIASNSAQNRVRLSEALKSDVPVAETTDSE